MFGVRKVLTKLSDAQKKKIEEKAVGIGGSVAGLGAIAFAVNSMELAGLSAAGITSGLAAIGGTMMGGIMVAAVAPAALGVAGYAGVRYVKLRSENRQLKEIHIDPRWEILVQQQVVEENKVDSVEEKEEDTADRIKSSEAESRPNNQTLEEISVDTIQEAIQQTANEREVEIAGREPESTSMVLKILVFAFLSACILYAF